MEQKTWWKGVTYPARIDYVSFQYNELVFVLAIEKLLELEVPRKATWMRMALCELVRIHSHLVYLGTSALEIGAISMFWYTFRERDLVLDLFEMVTGVRMHTRYFQAGGLAEDIPMGFYAQAREFCDAHAEGGRRLRGDPRRQQDLARAHAWRRAALGRRRDRARAERPRAARLRGRLGPAQARALSRLRPGRLRGARVSRRRRLRPLSRPDGRDARVDADHLPVRRSAPGDAGRAVDQRRPQGRAPAARGAAHLDGVADPPLQDRHRGLSRARGRGLRRRGVAARRVGRLRRLGRRAEAVAGQVPRALVRRARGDRDVHGRRGDRGSDRSRRLARRRDGGHRTDERRASEDSLRRDPGADGALSRSRARRRCRRSGSARRSTAGSRPTRFARWPRGSARRPPTAWRSRPSTTCSTWSRSGGIWSRCARTSRARSSVRSRCWRRSSSELGVRAGETTEDGDVTLRTIECAGGCGWGTVVGGRPPLPRAADGRGRARDRGGAPVPAEVDRVGRRRRARPDEARRVPRGGRLRRAREGAGDGAAGGDRRGARPRTCAAAAAPASRPGARRASSRSRRDAEADLPRDQCRRVRAGHVQGPRDHAPRPAPLPRGLPDHGPRDRVEERLHLHPRRVPRRVRGPARGARGGRAPPTCSAGSPS